jgi:hypothetical protein
MQLSRGLAASKMPHKPSYIFILNCIHLPTMLQWKQAKLHVIDDNLHFANTKLLLHTCAKLCFASWILDEPQPTIVKLYTH